MVGPLQQHQRDRIERLTVRQSLTLELRAQLEDCDQRSP